MDSYSDGIAIQIEDWLWNKNLPGIGYLDGLTRSNASKFRPEHLVHLRVGSVREKLWEGVEPLGSLKWMDLSECGNLTEIPDLSKATNLEELNLSYCSSLVIFPSTIGNLQKLVKLNMSGTGLEVLPVDVNLSSLEILNLYCCSSLRSFPLISTSIKELYLGYTAIEHVPCCVEKLSRLTKLYMRYCEELKTISTNIFSLTRLKLVDFTECGGIITVLSDGDARELILRSCFKSTMVLPGGEVPTHFEYRAYGNSLTVTLPQSSLSQEFLLFNACVVVEPLTEYATEMHIEFHFNGGCYFCTVDSIMPLRYKTDHLFLCSFHFRPTGLPSKLDFNDVKFKFSCFEYLIKECGIRLLNVSPYLDDKDGCSETEYNQQSGEIFDVAETQELLEAYTDYSCGQIETDTGLTAPNLEFPLGRGESSSVSSYPYLEGEREALCVDSMITEQQDAQTSIVYLDEEPSWSSSSARASSSNSL